MITIGCTEDDEARDMADIMRLHLPADWEYQVFLRGGEFTGNADSSRQVRREAVEEILAKAGPDGITVRDLRTQLNRAGLRTSRATLYRWLNRYLEDGKARNTRSRWFWVQEGALDEPGR